MPPKTRSRKASSKASIDNTSTNGTSNPTSSNNPDAVNNMRQSNVQSASDLPPPREHKRLKHRTSPPLQRAPWRLFNYTFIGIMFLAAAYYFYQMFALKTQAGGWWNLALGRRPPQMQPGGTPSPPQANTGSWWGSGSRSGSSQGGAPENGDDSLVQSRIDALAEALGMRSEDLSSAIAGAVKEHVPPASLSSVAAKETGRAARILAGDEDAAEQPGVIGNVAEGIGKVVGLDDSPEAGV